jgi:hypothetical protein
MTPQNQLIGAVVLIVRLAQKCPALLRTAFFRDTCLLVLLEAKEFAARQRGDHGEMSRIMKLRDFWNHADKGALARDEAGRTALTLLRMLHVHKTYRLVEDSENRKLEAHIFKPLLNAAKSPDCRFEVAVAGEKASRQAST